MTPDEALKTYVAVKAHLRGTYDIVKSRGRIRNCSIDDRNDRHKFEKLARKEDVRLYVAACLVRKPDMWVGEMVDTDFGDKVYAEVRSFVESVTYRMTQELESLPLPTLAENLKPISGKVPVVTAFRKREVSLETVALVDRVFPFIRDTAFSDPLDATRMPVIGRYGVFLPVSSATVRSAVNRVFTTHGEISAQ